MDFIVDFLLLDLAEFDKFGVSFPIGFFVTFLLFALSCSCFVINYRKMYTTETLRQLFRHEAISPDRAKTLKELRLNRASIRAALSRSGQLTYLVRRVGEESLSYEQLLSTKKSRAHKEEKIDFSAAKFYLDPQKIKRAENEIANGSTSWWQPTILTAIFIAIFILLAIFGVDMLTAINESVSA